MSGTHVSLSTGTPYRISQHYKALGEIHNVLLGYQLLSLVNMEQQNVEIDKVGLENEIHHVGNPKYSHESR